MKLVFWLWTTYRGPVLCSTLVSHPTEYMRWQGCGFLGSLLSSSSLSLVLTCSEGEEGCQVCAMLHPRCPPQQSMGPAQPFSLLSPSPTCPDQGHENPTSPSFHSPDLFSTAQWELCRGGECSEIHPGPQLLSAGSCTVWIPSMLEELPFKLQSAYEKFK